MVYMNAKIQYYSIKKTHKSSWYRNINSVSHKHSTPSIMSISQLAAAVQVLTSSLP